MAIVIPHVTHIEAFVHIYSLTILIANNYNRKFLYYFASYLDSTHGYRVYFKNHLFSTIFISFDNLILLLLLTKLLVNIIY